MSLNHALRAPNTTARPIMRPSARGGAVRRRTAAKLRVAQSCRGSKLNVNHSVALQCWFADCSDEIRRPRVALVAALVVCTAYQLFQPKGTPPLAWNFGRHWPHFDVRILFHHRSASTRRNPKTVGEEACHPSPGRVREHIRYGGKVSPPNTFNTPVWVRPLEIDARFSEVHAVTDPPPGTVLCRVVNDDCHKMPSRNYTCGYDRHCE